MNLPNRLTIIRIVLIPIYLIFLMIDTIPAHNYIAAVVFIAASLTDLFDGKIARKRGIETNFGKLADPLADKLLTGSAFIFFVSLGIMPAWACVVIIAREFAVSGFRLILAGNGKVLAATMLGKYKTTFQMLYIIIATLNGAVGYNWMNLSDGALNVYNIVTTVFMYIVIVLTVLSMLEIFYKNKDNFSTKE